MTLDPKRTATIKIDPEDEQNNKKLTLPDGQTIDAKDITTTLRAYYKLSKNDQIKEKDAWLNVINQIFPPNPKGEIITDILILPDDKDNHKIVFAYGNNQII